MKKISIVVIALVLFAPRLSLARDLIDIIPGLYGGNGITLGTAPAASHEAHFTLDTTSSINRLNQQLATQVGVFPFSSSMGGVRFAFDPAEGAFVRTAETLGPLFAEAGPTLGKGKFNVHFSSTFFSYDEFEGQSLNKLQVTARHDPDIIGFPDEREQFEFDTVQTDFDIDMDVRIFSLAASYGLTDRLDIGILLPLVNVNMKVKSTAHIITSEENFLFPDVHSFENGPESANDRGKESAFGIGDLVLRAKYHFLDSEMVDVSGAIVAKLATGDEDNFLGSGTSTIRPFLVLSRTFANIWSSRFHFTPHLNVGYEFNIDDSSDSSVEYATGFDIGTPTVAFVADLIGSHEPYGDAIGDKIMTASLGVKYNLYEHLLVFGNFQLPLNSEGLRSDVIPTFGLEYSF